MTLAEFATLVDAPTKWVLNTNALLGFDAQYKLEDAEHLALIRVLNRDFSIALPRALELARTVLQSTGQGDESGIVQLLVDVTRLRAAIATRRSQLATQHAPRRAGRKPGRVAPIAAAKRYGLDITLLQDNLTRRPIERLRQLDGMMAFSKAVRSVK
jgi:hypothetical protein